MGLSIGDINFAVDADTTGLKNAINQLNRFTSEVNKAAKATDTFTQQSVTAYAKQESAIKKAFQQTLNLRRELKKSGANAAEVSKVSLAFKKLTKELTSGKLSTLQYTRAMDAFNAKLARSNRTLKDIKSTKVQQGIGGLAGKIRDLESAAVLAVGPLSGIGARISALGSIANRETLALAALVGGVVGASVALYKLVAGALTASQSMERINAALFVATGSTLQARKEFEFAATTANSLGLEIESTAIQYSKLSAAAKGTSLQGEGIRKVFAGITKGAAGLKLKTEQVEGAFRAVEQMMSKGNVQAEEIRGQFAERIVGAFQLAAKSMGYTTQEFGKLLKQGKIAAEDLLPKLAAEFEQIFGPQAAKNVNTLAGAMNLVANATFMFSNSFNEALGVSQSAISIMQGTSSAIGFLTENLNSAVALMTILAGPVILKGIILLYKGIRATTLGMVGLNAAMLANPAIGLTTILARLALGTVGATAAFFGVRAALDSANEGFINFNENIKFMSAEALETEAEHVFKVIDSIEAKLSKMKAVQEDPRGEGTAWEKFKRVFTGIPTPEDITVVGNDLDAAMTRLGAIISRLDKIYAEGSKGEGANAFQDKIDKLIAKLKEQAETFGMTSQELLKHRMGVMNATTAELSLADSYTITVAELKAADYMMKLYTDNLKKQNQEAIKLHDTQKKAAEQIRKDIDPYRAYAQEMEKLSALLSKGLIDENEFEAKATQIRESIRRMEIDDLGLALMDVQSLSRSMGDSIANTFERAAFEGGKFKDVISSLILELARLVAQEAVTKPLANLLTSSISAYMSGGASYDAAGDVSSSQFIGPRRAAGGNVNKGSSYWVGEQGPELFTPSGGGMISSNRQSGSAVYQTISIDARGATPGMEDQIKRAALDGARMGYQQAVNDKRRNGILR